MIVAFALAIAFTIINAPESPAQRLVMSEWETISSLRTARDSDVDAEGNLWVATSGGLYKLNVETNAIEEYRNINALQSLDVRSVLCIPDRNLVVVGASDGSIDIRDTDGTWLAIADIKRATQYQRRGITDLVHHNNVLYIASEFGVLVFDLATRLFVETIDRIGTLQEKTRVNGIVVHNDSLWIATDSGVARAWIAEPTLRPPGVWTVLSTGIGLPAGSISLIASDGIAVYASAGQDVFSIVQSVAEKRASAPYPIRSLTTQLGAVYFSSFNGLESLSGRLPISWSRGTFIGHNSVLLNGEPVQIGYIEGHGIDVFRANTVYPFPVGGPNSNQFARMAFDRNGALWIATDIEPPQSGSGVNVYDGEQWYSLTPNTNPELQTAACYRVSALRDGSVLVGTWGRGGVRIFKEGETFTIQTLTPENSAVQGIASDASYSLVADAQTDRIGNVWMVNEQATNQILVLQNSSLSTEAISNCTDPRSNHYRTLAIDNASNKWLGSTTGLGLLVWNDKATSDRSDDICNVVRTSNSQLQDNVITALALDKSGALWIGTPRGVAVISTPSSVSNSVIPFVRRISVISSVVVNDIFVDALNYKWIATTVGVFVLSEDGTTVLAEITKSNSPLIDENIRCVAVNPRNGRAYFGTSLGCMVAQSTSIEPSPEYQLRVWPQPFEQGKHSQIVIDGLAADSDVRILTVGGFLVQALQTRGRQVTWDGKDVQGRDVPPGVYVVQVTSASTKQSAVAKIAIRR